MCRWCAAAGTGTAYCIEVDVYGLVHGAGVCVRGALGCACRFQSRVWCNGQNGLTVLHLAVQRGHTEVVEMLLGLGADPKAADRVLAAMCRLRVAVCDGAGRKMWWCW